MKILIFLLLSLHLFSRDTIYDVSMRPVGTVFLESINLPNKWLKNEKGLKGYFNSHKEHKSKSSKHSNFTSYLNSIIEHSKYADSSHWLPWKLTACNSFVESRFAEKGKSKYAYGIGQLESKTLNNLLSTSKEHFDVKNYNTCTKICPKFTSDHSYQNFLSDFTCHKNTSRCLKKSGSCDDDIAWCKKVYKTIYRSKQYQAMAFDYFYLELDGPYQAPYKVSWSKSFNPANWNKAYIYPYNYKHGIFLSSYALYKFSSDLDGYLYERGKKLLGKNAKPNKIIASIRALFQNDTDRFRGMQLLAASYNTGPGKLRSTLIRTDFTSMSQMYENFLDMTYKRNHLGGKENRKHLLSVGRCMAYKDLREPYFNKHKSNNVLDSLIISQKFLD